MRVIRHCTIKVIPGKMGEFLKLQEELDALANRLGAPPRNRYSCISGESMHTLIYATEWDSLAAMEDFFETLYVDLAAREVSAKIADITESHEIKFYMPCPREYVHKFPDASGHVKV